MNDELQEVGKYYNMVVEFFINYSMQIVGAIIILVFGIIVSKQLQKAVLRILLKHNFDETLSQFVANFIRFIVIAMVVILALGKIGISVAPFIAAVGALSLTAGLALQGSVSNFAAGIVLIATKPFKIGDTITVHDVYGEVQEIKLAYTVLVNEDKEQITIPNKYMIGDVLVNSFEYRVVEGSIGISYDSNIDKALDGIKEVLASHQELNKENEPIVGIEKFNDSSIDIAYRYWAPTKSFFKTQYAVNAQVFHKFQNENIVIPFPQREIKIVGEKDV
ncbi:MAG: mechanosensitive ion channel [Campylobacterales bacterium]|nr:mechanosensitive ion channel [Campylobacterales bacterium]